MPPFKDGPEGTVLTPDSIPQLISQEPAVAANRLEYFLKMRGDIFRNTSGLSVLITAHSLDQYC